MATQVETVNSHGYVKRPYFIVFLTLGLLTILELNLGFISEIAGEGADVEGFINLALIVLALLKAYLVAAFFMGIKYQDNPKVVYGVMFGIPMFIALPVVIIPALGTIAYLCGL
ncbi:MAG: cytochrome C oxidase subunit IV family protein [Candidatus Hodarchaeales archaeon]